MQPRGSASPLQQKAIIGLQPWTVVPQTAHRDTNPKAPARAASHFPRLRFALGMAAWEMCHPQPRAVYIGLCG